MYNRKVSITLAWYQSPGSAPIFSPTPFVLFPVAMADTMLAGDNSTASAMSSSTNSSISSSSSSSTSAPPLSKAISSVNIKSLTPYTLSMESNNYRKWWNLILLILCKIEEAD